MGSGMVRSRQVAAQKAQQELADQLEPGLTILARVTPAWPAMIMKETDLPEDVLKVKPSKKVVIPVLFYNDNTFQWISPSEAEVLDPATATKASKSKIKKTLKEAYAIAASTPSYESIIEKLRQPAVAAVSEVTEADTTKMEDDESASGGKTRRARSAAEQAQTVSRAKRVRLPQGKPGAVKKEEEEEEEDSEYVDSGSASTGTSTSTETGVETTDGEFDEKSLANKQALRFDLCCEARKALQVNLLNPLLDQEKADIGEKELKRCEELVSTVLSTAVELSVMRRSKLTRVVSLVLATDVPAGLKEKLEALAAECNTQPEPVIRGIPEHLAPADETRENTEEPEAASEPASEAAESVKMETPAAETPAAEVPVSEALTSGPPTSETPAAEPPASEAPTAEPLTSEAPAAEPSNTEAPAAEAPAAEAPADTAAEVPAVSSAS